MEPQIKIVRTMIVGPFDGLQSLDFRTLIPQLPKGSRIQFPGNVDYRRAVKTVENDEWIDILLFTDDDERTFADLVALYGPFVPRLRCHPNQPWVLTQSPEYNVLLSPFRLNGVHVCESGFADAILERLDRNKTKLN